MLNNLLEMFMKILMNFVAFCKKYPRVIGLALLSCFIGSLFDSFLLSCIVLIVVLLFLSNYNYHGGK